MATRIALFIAMMSVYVGICVIVPGFEVVYLVFMTAGTLGGLFGTRILLGVRVLSQRNQQSVMG